MPRKNGGALHSVCALSPSTGSGRRLSKGGLSSAFCALSLSKGGLQETCWHVGWPGPESNRRPFTFQANATTD
jgi:hypothetical protein